MTTQGLFLCLLAVFVLTQAKYGCKDMSGNDVDWFVSFKAPVETGSNDPIYRDGYAWSYADASTTLDWTGTSLNDTNGAMYETLQQIYDKRSEVDDYAWFYYNDEDPTGAKHSSYGHTKGVASFNSDSGFWLIHSVPKWPNGSSVSYGYPSYETTYGQSFLCVTYDYLTFNDIGSNWKINKPYVYDYNFPSSFSDDLPNIVDVINHDFITTEIASQVLTLTSDGGTDFNSFAKNAEWDQDLYEFLVAPTLKSDLYVETWMNGANPLPTFCETSGTNLTYNVVNVRDVELDGVEWTETKDHSKWAVSTSDFDNGVKYYACIGDINRQEGQENRAGGTSCFYEPTLWGEMTGMINSADSCPTS
uniref:Uncharacterized protein n=1 Tax=Paramoeba aestuarina TaxID=180227 RepID=A0A7S4UUX5_9EUKA|mmetsp:Transcript_40283/g.63746  ORF Transcript_40283/g.63746 Transcript_40283/m.63746 type:complete len:361 (+) Transcript_40283:55-1137(+)|eukprot:CAMPEP_0201512632 /NCGR_PEP_ID=MMETSP0161_2-20130828/4827_1 /ASSEMBLY_ACC=CAM_ASM_000251 /TAXON_ID=180227 /ORGANISM="Neoparamoeba aestuarina, Strain SoJaBio B1-5/56/2" /LENGTH=360 /DNA_ID=CAMNT_0047908539 /DNA_START=40 /DNA_END=1122 /DNA_ORIENTATION=+